MISYANFVRELLTDINNSEEAEIATPLVLGFITAGVVVSGIVSLAGDTWLPFIVVSGVLLAIAVFLLLIFSVTTFFQWISKGY